MEADVECGAIVEAAEAELALFSSTWSKGSW
jgi:hypothetical protein